MPYTVTEFQRPEPTIEFEELQPVIVQSGTPIIVVDPNKPPGMLRAWNCCKCNEGPNGCHSEQIEASQSTDSNGMSIASIFG